MTIGNTMNPVIVAWTMVHSVASFVMVADAMSECDQWTASYSVEAWLPILGLDKQVPAEKTGEVLFVVVVVVVGDDIGGGENRKVSHCISQFEALIPGHASLANKWTDLADEPISAAKRAKMAKMAKREGPRGPQGEASAQWHGHAGRSLQGPGLRSGDQLLETVVEANPCLLLASMLAWPPPPGRRELALDRDSPRPFSPILRPSLPLHQGFCGTLRHSAALCGTL
ncbi:hypothetical protein E4U53_002616 [Claviceps sorghi]|nr:hypothetical protein E4U53_002616 [Claviceps sorghi]